MISSKQVDFIDVTIARDDDNQDKAHIFQYNLNVSRTRKKIYEGALREPYQREEKKGCTLLIFSDGAFKEVVMKALVELKNSPKHLTISMKILKESQ